MHLKLFVSRTTILQHSIKFLNQVGMSHTFAEKTQSMFSALGSDPNTPPPFQLRTSQHKNVNVTGEYQPNEKFDVLNMTKKPSVNYTFEEEEPQEENEENEQTLNLVQPNQNTSEQKKMLICVKRKRDEEPLDDFYLEIDDTRPKQKRIKNVHKVTNAMGSINLENEQKKSVRFSLVETVVKRQTDTDKHVFAKAQERKTLKQTTNDTSIKEKNLKKMKNAHQVRFAKIVEKRRLDEGINVVDVDLEQDNLENVEDFNDPSLKNYASLLKEHYNSGDDQYEYDYYYLDDSAGSDARGNKTIVKMESFDDTIFIDGEYNRKEDSDYDSEDSNRSDNINNDYPDELTSEPDSDNEGDDDFSYNDPYGRRPKKVHESYYDDDDDDEDEPDMYRHNDEYYNY
jgi:hypothetical protein